MASCAQAPEPIATHYRPDVGQSALIAMGGSAYKRLLVAKIVEQLEAVPCNVVAVNLGELKPGIEDEFDAVVIVNKCWAGSLDRSVSAYLKQKPNARKIVLVTTSRSGWRPKKVAVDSVTAASRKENVEEVATQITRLVLKRLQPKKTAP